MSNWWQNVLRFERDGDEVRVVTPWHRETYLPAPVVDGGDRGLFLMVEPDLLGETIVRFAVANGYAQYRVDALLPEIWDEPHAYGYTHPVYRLRLSKGRKSNGKG